MKFNYRYLMALATVMRPMSERWPLRYNAAYLTSNENLRYQMSVVNGAKDNVLTVAASGDQPLFYAAHGARHIDTFDMTICAQAVMDLKTTIIANSGYDVYCNFCKEAFCTQYESGDLLTFSGVIDALSKMPVDEANFIKCMNKYNLFQRDSGLTCLSYDEFKAVQHLATKPFNFIWSDITDLHTKLTTDYDIINVSNIFEWIERRKSPTVVAETIKNLFAHLKPGGYIIATSFDNMGQVRGAFSYVARQMWDLAQFSSAEFGDTYYVLQRTR